MANIFKVTAKRRDKEGEAGTQPEVKPSEESQPSQTMTQSDFLYGTEGMTRRKPKGRPPASMNP